MSTFVVKSDNGRVLVEVTSMLQSNGPEVLDFAPEDARAFARLVLRAADNAEAKKSSDSGARDYGTSPRGS